MRFTWLTVAVSGSNRVDRPVAVHSEPKGGRPTGPSGKWKVRGGRAVVAPEGSTKVLRDPRPVAGVPFFPMEEVRRLKERFLQAGGAAGVFEEAGRGYLTLGDSQHQDGVARPREARGVAERCLAPGRLLEIQCYDERGRPQGEAVLKFVRWESKVGLAFRAEYLSASNGYYAWWCENEADHQKLLYHFCLNARSRCHLEGGVHDQVVHVAKWRMTSPQAHIGHGYASDKVLAFFRRSLEDYLADQPALPPAVPAAAAPEFPPAPAAPGPKNRQTSGLDAAQDLARDERHGDDEVVDDLLAFAGRAKRGLAPAEKPEQHEKPSKGLGAVLVGKAKAVEEDKEEKLRRRLEKKRSRRDEDVDAGRLARRKRKDIKDSDSDGKGSADSEPGFRVASGQVVSYLHQILLPQFPKAGLRAQRELITLGSSLDLLLKGELGRVGDLLVQRFKAIEASLAADGNWMVARHQELIPSRSCRASSSETQATDVKGRRMRPEANLGSRRRRSVDFRDAKKVELAEASSRQSISDESFLQRSGSPNGTSNISCGEGADLSGSSYSKARAAGSCDDWPTSTSPIRKVSLSRSPKKSGRR